MEPKEKKKKLMQRYRAEYSKEWPCLIKSKVSECHVFCTVCGSDFSVQYGGRDDCRRHVESNKHAAYGKAKAESMSISNFFQSSNDNEVIKAEMLFTSFIIEHNLAIASADHAAPLFRAMFPDSKIAKKYSCARTKTTAIVKDMAKMAQAEITELLQNNPFSLATDGSNDTDNVKLYPVVVSVFNEAVGKIDSLLLSICQSNDNTGKGIFNVLKEEFQKRNIPWKNCLSFASDNANTMVGQYNGVVAFLKQVQPEIVTLGCSCHLLHLAAKKATAQLQLINVEEFLIQLYYFLDKSSKRKNGFKASQIVCGLKPHKILKYVSTRWLSLLDAINRVLEKWDALEHFFSDVNNSTNLLIKIKDPMCKLYFLFLSNALPIFNNINVLLQVEAPSIHLLHKYFLNVFTELIVRFVKPSALPENSVSILDIDFQKKKNQKDNDDLVIGSSAKCFIKKTSFTEEQLNDFYLEVKNFYKAACEYMLKKFPVNEEMLKHAQIADISLRKTVSYSSVEFFASIFSSVLSTEEKNRLEGEFAFYQFENLQDITLDRMDTAWNQISQIKDVNGLKKYIALPKLMLALLLIPHSNALTERIFSIVRKNSNEFRPSLGVDVLNALLISKIKNKEACFNKKFTTEQMQSAKRATRLSMECKK